MTAAVIPRPGATAPRRVVAITGASAGVGCATAQEFARHGWDAALIARNGPRLEALARTLRREGINVLPLVADVVDFDTLDAAATRVERELGPIDVWVNNAMATIFAPVHRISAAEYRRGTEVTYLGQVHGTMAALARMRPRDRGIIINVGSALAYRAIPLQSVYCGAKYAVRGFTDALRTELIHDGSGIKLVMVQLPALNTPQFDWALNKTGQRPQPVPPIYQPEVAARAIFRAALDPRHREVWVGNATLLTILANRVAPGLLDRYLARAGYRGQLTGETQPEDAPANLFQSVDGCFGAHGRFDHQARGSAWDVDVTGGRPVLAALALMALFVASAGGIAALRNRRS